MTRADMKVVRPESIRPPADKTLAADRLDRFLAEQEPRRRQNGDHSLGYACFECFFFPDCE